MDTQFARTIDDPVKDVITHTVSQIDNADSITELHVERCVTLHNHRRLPLVISRLTGETAILHADTTSHNGPSIAHVSSLDGVFTTRSYLLSLSGHFLINGQAYDNILILDGPSEFYFMVDSKFHGRQRHIHDLDDLMADARDRIRGKDSVGAHIKEAEYDYYDVSSRDLVAVMEDNGIPNISKILTAFYTYLPMCRTTIALLAHLAPTPLNVQQTIAGWAPNEPHQDIIAAASGIGLFAPAYTIKENMPTQIERRLKAVAAASGVSPPANNVVSDLFTTSGMGPIDFPACLVPVLASAVCIDDQGDVDPDVKTDSLMDITELATRYGLTNWVVELLTQMRLIYTAYQASSLRFGLSVLPLIISFFESIGGRFREELEAMRAVDNVLSNARYTGMKSKIPDALQVKTVARVVYIGLGYYRKCLHTEEEKKAFERYATAAIRHHIAPTSDADMCDNIIHVLPDRSLVAAIALGENLSYEEMDIIMQRYTPVEQSIVYKSLIRLNHPGEWAEYKKKVADNEASRSMMKEAMKKISEEEITVEREFDIKTKMCHTDVEYYDLMRRLESWKDRVTTLKRGLQNLEDLVPLSQDPTFQLVRDQVLEKMKALFEAIRDTGDRRAPTPDPEDPPAAEEP